MFKHEALSFTKACRSEISDPARLVWYSQTNRHTWSTNLITHLSRAVRIAASVGLFTFLMLGTASANEDRPVQSLLEIRRVHIMIQNSDLSCGAAALGTLLRYQFGENITERKIARALMSRGEYVRHPELVQAREGFSLLDLKRYVEAFGARMVKRGISHKQARNRRQSDSLSSLFQRRKGHDSPLIRTISIYKGEGLGQLALNDLIQRAPIMVPINANGYNHFVVFRGVLANRVLIADPAWGNRTMTADKFQRMWIDYGEPIGHVGFVITRADGGKAPNRLQPTMREFVMLQ